MKRKNIAKKVISLLLTAVLLMSVAVPAFAADEEYPTIYVVGTMEEIYNAKGEQVYPIGLDIGETLSTAIKPCIEKLLLGLVTGDYEEYAQEFYNAFVPYFADCILDKNGEASNGTDVEFDYWEKEVPRKTANYGFWDYVYWYDWRLSTVEVGNDLAKYIDLVKEATGKDKVNIISRCYGSNVVAAYLQYNQEHAVDSVNAVTYYTASIEGIDFLSALFSGEIHLESDAMDNFVNYFLDNNDVITDETTKTLVLTLVDLLNQIELLGLTGDAVEGLVNEVKTALIPKIVRDSFGGWLSHWAMVTPDLYEQARDFVFAGYEEEYAGFIAKADDYHYNVQLKFDETTKYLQNEGIKFYNITKYNFPCYPIFEGGDAQSDGYTTVEVQSFGATSAPYGEILSEKYIAGMEDTTHLSPDKVIDASTSLLPETTWFIKDLYHDNFDDVVHFMIMDLMNNDIKVSDGKYAQFLQFSEGKLNPVAETEEVNDGESKFSPLMSLMRFFTSLFNFISSLFRGELDFSNIFGGLTGGEEAA